MGFRFGKSIKLGKVFRLNLSKSGIGVSAGVKGLRVGVGPRGTRLTASIPGTGVSYVAESGEKKTSKNNRDERVARPRHEPEDRADWNLLPQVEKDFIQGMRLYRSGDHEGALRHFYSVSHADGIGYFLTALIFALTGRDDKAIEWLESLVRADVNFPTFLMQKYKVDESEIKLRVTSRLSISIPINNLGAALLLTELYQKQQRFSEAIGLLEQIREEVKSSILDLSLCELYFARDVDDGVVEIGKNNQVSDNCTFEIAVMYGQILQKRRLHEGAIQVFTEALRKKNNKEKELICEAMYQRAISYQETGKVSRAKTEFEKIYALKPDFRDIAPKLGLQEAKRFCGNCGQKITPPAKFCSNCGAAVWINNGDRKSINF